MADISWIKLKTQMFDDEKIKLIEDMPEADAILIIWVKLLIQAGKSNASGHILLSENIPYSSEMLSTIFRRPLQIIKFALKILSDLGMIEVEKSNVIRVTNWEKHQNIEGMDKIKEQNRLRQAKYREHKLLNPAKKQKNGNVISRDSNAIDLELDKELDIRYIDARKVWIQTIGKNPNTIQLDDTVNLIDKYGIKIVTNSFRDWARRDKMQFQTFLNNLDEKGNLKPYEINNGKPEGITIEHIRN